eukprot:2172866-Pleurochrysis_carterae.AAC.2
MPTLQSSRSGSRRVRSRVYAGAAHRLAARRGRAPSACRATTRGRHGGSGPATGASAQTRTCAQNSNNADAQTRLGERGGADGVRP